MSWFIFSGKAIIFVELSIHQIRNIYRSGKAISLISQIWKTVGPFGEKFDFFSAIGFEIKTDFGHEVAKSSSIHSERPYFDEKFVNFSKLTSWSAFVCQTS